MLTLRRATFEDSEALRALIQRSARELSDPPAERDSGELDPRTEAAKIRAFFVDPAHARRGIGTLLLEKCESEARLRGFSRVELMSTLPGVRLYSARGYAATRQVRYAMAPGLDIEFVPMSKTI